MSESVRRTNVAGDAETLCAKSSLWRCLIFACDHPRLAQQSPAVLSSSSTHVHGDVSDSGVRNAYKSAAAREKEPRQVQVQVYVRNLSGEVIATWTHGAAAGQSKFRMAVTPTRGDVETERATPVVYLGEIMGVVERATGKPAVSHCYFPTLSTPTTARSRTRCQAGAGSGTFSTSERVVRVVPASAFVAPTSYRSFPSSTSNEHYKSSPEPGVLTLSGRKVKSAPTGELQLQSKHLHEAVDDDVAGTVSVHNEDRGPVCLPHGCAPAAIPVRPQPSTQEGSRSSEERPRARVPADYLHQGGSEQEDHDARTQASYSSCSCTTKQERVFSEELQFDFDGGDEDEEALGLASLRTAEDIIRDPFALLRLLDDVDCDQSQKDSTHISASRTLRVDLTVYFDSRASAALEMIESEYKVAQACSAYVVGDSVMHLAREEPRPTPSAPEHLIDDFKPRRYRLPFMAANDAFLQSDVEEEVPLDWDAEPPSDSDDMSGTRCWQRSVDIDRLTRPPRRNLDWAAAQNSTETEAERLERLTDCPFADNGVGISPYLVEKWLPSQEGAAGRARALHNMYSASFGPERIEKIYAGFQNNETFMLLYTEVCCRFSVLCGANPLIVPQAQNFSWCVEDEDRGRKVARALLACSINGLAFRYLPRSARDESQIAEVAVRADWRAFRYASKRLRCSDRGLALLAVSQCGWALKYCRGRLRCDPDLVRTAVADIPWALRYAAKALWNDRELLEIVAENDGGAAMCFASEDLAADADFVKLAVSTNGLCVRHAAPALLAAERDISRLAIYENPHAVWHLPRDVLLENDAELLFLVLQRAAELRTIRRDDMRFDTAYTDAVLRYGGEEFFSPWAPIADWQRRETHADFCCPVCVDSVDFRGIRERHFRCSGCLDWQMEQYQEPPDAPASDDFTQLQVEVAALTRTTNGEHERPQTSSRLGCFVLSLFTRSSDHRRRCGFGRDDFDLVFLAVTNEPLSLRLASKRLRSNWDLVKAAVSRDATAFLYASDELRTNSSFVVAALEDAMRLREKFASELVPSSPNDAERAAGSWNCFLRNEIGTNFLPFDVRQDLLGRDKDLTARAIKAMPWCYLGTTPAYLECSFLHEDMGRWGWGWRSGVDRDSDAGSYQDEHSREDVQYLGWRDDDDFMINDTAASAGIASTTLEVEAVAAEQTASGEAVENLIEEHVAQSNCQSQRATSGAQIIVHDGPDVAGRCVGASSTSPKSRTSSIVADETTTARATSTAEANEKSRPPAGEKLYSCCIDVRGDPILLRIALEAACEKLSCFSCEPVGYRGFRSWYRFVRHDLGPGERNEDAEPRVLRQVLESNPDLVLLILAGDTFQIDACSPDKPMTERRRQAEGYYEDEARVESVFRGEEAWVAKAFGTADRKAVLFALRHCGAILRYAPEPLRSDLEAVLLAVSSDATALDYAASSLRYNLEVLRGAARAVRRWSRAPHPYTRPQRDKNLEDFLEKYFEECCAWDKDVVLDFLPDYPSLFFLLPTEELRGDWDIARRTLEFDDDNFMFERFPCSRHVYRDKAMVLQAVKRHPGALLVLDRFSPLWKDEDVRAEFRKQCPSPMQMFSDFPAMVELTRI